MRAREAWSVGFWSHGAALKSSYKKQTEKRRRKKEKGKRKGRRGVGERGRLCDAGD